MKLGPVIKLVFFVKKRISKIREVLVLKCIFSETTHLCVLRRGSFTPSLPPNSKRTPKKPTDIRVKNI